MEPENIVVNIKDFEENMLEIKNITTEDVKKKAMYLDDDLIGELRNVILSSPIFWRDENYHPFYNQVCAVMDRLSTAVDYVIKVSFNVLKKYIKSRYENLKLITQWVESEILRNKGIWKAQGIVRGQTPIETLYNIKQALINQSQDIYEIDNYISYLTCNLTNKNNFDNVNKFRSALIDRIDTIYRYATELDYVGLYEEMEIIYSRPKNMHQHAHYQLEKIFCNLDDRCDYGNIIWGRKQAYEFSKGFAKKWVTIDAENMSFEEIKLLVSTACYLEYEEQEVTNKLRILGNTIG